ncbi:MAG: DUF1858 domain-containing protein, partial [Lachnospiraceae bacterium]|nr:DUF1858 domain-containing protein [Lachnospiraceae bacterium]
MFRINKDTKIGEILDIAPDMAQVFTDMGLHCVGCPSSRGETLEQACEVHDLDV